MADMTEKHRLAVALAYQRAADAAYDLMTSTDPVIQEARIAAAITFFETDIDKPAEQCKAAILALAPADALAELARLRSKLEAAEKLAEASAGVIQRWDSQDWKSGHTGDFITRLRAAVGAYEEAGK